MTRSASHAASTSGASLPPGSSGPATGPDPALLRAVAAGEPGAVDAWFRAEHGPVYRLCLGLLADADRAADVAQDALLHLIEHLGGYDPTRAWRPWRDTVVVRLCRDRQRRVAARARAEERAGDASLGGRRRAAGEPFEALEAAELRDEVSAALACVPAREREAFVLRDLEGLQTAEVAAAMEVTPATVRSLLSLARRRLRDRLARRLGEGDPTEARA